MSTHPSPLPRQIALEAVRVTEKAAVAAARMRGRGDEKIADQVAVDAMRKELNILSIDGEVVIGEGERDEAPMLYIGEKVGRGGVAAHIALDPLEGTTICAKNQPNALTVIAIAAEGNLLRAPDVYMDKIAIGPGYREGLVDLDAPVQENLKALAEAKGVSTDQITACILDRPRHQSIIAGVREVGASLRLISDGDIAGVIHTCDPEETGIDIYLGIGGAPEGVLAAAALACTGGQIQGRLVLDTPEKKARAAKMGVEDPGKKFTLSELASGDVIFAATGVTDGNLLRGVRFSQGRVRTQSIVLRSSSGTKRWIDAEHKVE